MLNSTLVLDWPHFKHPAAICGDWTEEAQKTAHGALHPLILGIEEKIFA